MTLLTVVLSLLPLAASFTAAPAQTPRRTAQRLNVLFIAADIRSSSRPILIGSRGAACALTVPTINFRCAVRHAAA
jgi:hypothetical protein